jgi:hypothetical protein
MAALTSADIIQSINDNFVNQLALAGAAVGNWDSAAFVRDCAANAAAIAAALAANVNAAANARQPVPAPAPPTQATIADAVVGNSGLHIPAAGNELSRLLVALNASEVLNPKTNRIIYNVPKSDELLRRFVAPLFAKSKGVDILQADLRSRMEGNVVDSMPKSDSDVYISLLTITPDQKANLKKYDDRVDQIREALSQGLGPTASTIPPSNVIPHVLQNNISVISSYPAGLKAALLEKRKSDSSNPLNAAATLNRIRIAMNGGANNMTGGNASKAAPLYPRFVMHGGAHPLAVMEGGAAPAAPAAPAAAAGPWNPARGTPNPVALLDARIKELEAQFKSATGQGINADLAGTIRDYSNNVNNNIVGVQKSLKELADANAALAQYPLGLGMNATSFDAAKLNQISAQADKINKDAARASKQLDKLSQIKDTLEELVNKTTPAPRA